MLPPLIRSAQDLVTQKANVIEGFLKQSITKIDKAAPYIAQAKHLEKVLGTTNQIEELISIETIKDELSAAIGLSDKAISHLSKDDLSSILKRGIAAIATSSGDNWKEEIVFRFLLTKGDSLGGSMRNVTGALAGAQFTEAVTNALTVQSIAYKKSTSLSNPNKIQYLSWKDRILLFDKTPSFLKKNVDAILLRGSEEEGIKALLSKPDLFIACGEIKGGIDPAGADEHWKTANSAFNRIRANFGENVPALFFMGAAIESAMANEIFEQLNSDRLDYAANLTSSEQMVDLADWIISL